MAIPFVGAIIAKVVGSALGKAAEKAISYIPDKNEYIRNKIDKLHKERDELKNNKTISPAKRDKRLNDIAIQLSTLIKSKVNQ